MMTPRCITGLLLVCIPIFAPEARAQATSHSALAKALAKLPSTESLRVRGDSGVFEGQVDPMASDTLRLHTKTSAIVALPARTVRNVWVKRNIRAEAGGIGAMVGAVIGASIGTVSRGTSLPCTSAGCTDAPKTKIVSHTLVGGIAGGMMGWIAGGVYRRWSQVFPD